MVSRKTFFSYPHIYNYKNKKYIFPEMSEDNQNLVFELKSNKNIFPIKNYLFGDNVVESHNNIYQKFFFVFVGLKVERKYGSKFILL